jgi:hypothetical protein
MSRSIAVVKRSPSESAAQGVGRHVRATARLRLRRSVVKTRGRGVVNTGESVFSYEQRRSAFVECVLADPQSVVTHRESGFTNRDSRPANGTGRPRHS